MPKKIDAVIALVLLEGNFFNRDQMSGLIQLSMSTQDTLLKNRIGEFLDVIETSDMRGYTYEYWKQLLFIKKDSIIRYAKMQLGVL